MSSPSSGPGIDIIREHLVGGFLALALGVLVLSRPAIAHASGLGGSRETVTIPVWLVLLTGGAVIGASFLLVSMITDRRFIDSINGWGRSIAIRTPRWLSTIGGALGVAVLGALVVIGFAGPQRSSTSLTVLFVWAIWWAGYAMSVYLIGNTWPVFDPWRFLADAIPIGPVFDYPDRVGSWPALLGLFALVWVEVTTPITERPSLLATVVAVYTIVTVTGGVLFGTRAWFDRADPVARVFRVFGWIAPVQRTADGLELGLPGWFLGEEKLVEDADEVAFVLALLWLTTYDGFVATPTWNAILTPLVEAGVPPLLGYLGLLIFGYGLFIAAYVLASRYAKRVANTLLDETTIALRFAQAVLPIAAGYHLAHYIGYFVQLLPSTVVLATGPFSPPAQLPVVVIPAWFGTFQLFFVLIGHVVAIWVAHGIAFETFTGRIQPLRSQYPYTLAMVLYTMVSIGIVYQPSITPPHL